MLRDIDALILNRCPLLLQTVSPPIETLPMDPAAKDYPLAQIRNLKCPSRVMVFRTVQTSAICKRHSAHFDNLLAEEQKFYAHSLDAKGNPPKTKNFGWHGAPLENIRGILQCGFLIASTPRVGNIFGHGVYLATEENGALSLNPLYSQPDANGIKYLLLCEILPGTVEPSVKGQVRPTSFETAHSGVDRLPDPRMHIFWSYDMNARIRPKYVVMLLPKITVFTKRKGSAEEGGGAPQKKKTKM